MNIKEFLTQLLNRQFAVTFVEKDGCCLAFANEVCMGFVADEKLFLKKYPSNSKLLQGCREVPFAFSTGVCAEVPTNDEEFLRQVIELTYKSSRHEKCANQTKNTLSKVRKTVNKK